MAADSYADITDLTALASADGSADYITVADASAATSKKSTRNTFLGLASEPVGRTDTQTITNKTLTAPTISSPVLSGTITGTYTIGGTPTFPSSVVSLTGSQTLTNKTLTSPTINSPTITNPTITVDSIAEYTAANGVSIDGMLIKDGTVGAGTITPAGLVTGAGTTWVWQTWTPTFTNISTATATTTALYTQIGKTVHYYLKFLLGASSGIGTAPSFTLPLTAARTGKIVGHIWCEDTGTANYQGYAIQTSTTAADLRVGNSAGTYATLTAITASIPHAWASTDFFEVVGSYERS
jgi:hypothetical protein